MILKKEGGAGRGRGGMRQQSFESSRARTVDQRWTERAKDLI